MARGETGIFGEVQAASIEVPVPQAAPSRPRATAAALALLDSSKEFNVLAFAPAEMTAWYGPFKHWETDLSDYRRLAVRVISPATEAEARSYGLERYPTVMIFRGRELVKTAETFFPDVGGRPRPIIYVADFLAPTLKALGGPEVVFAGEIERLAAEARERMGEEPAPARIRMRYDGEPIAEADDKMDLLSGRPFGSTRYHRFLEQSVSDIGRSENPTAECREDLKTLDERRYAGAADALCGSPDPARAYACFVNEAFADGQIHMFSVSFKDPEAIDRAVKRCDHFAAPPPPPPAPALCPFVYTEIERQDCHYKGVLFDQYFSAWAREVCTKVPVTKTKMIPCDQIPR